MTAQLPSANEVDFILNQLDELFSRAQESIRDASYNDLFIVMQERAHCIQALSALVDEITEGQRAGLLVKGRILYELIQVSMEGISSRLQGTQRTAPVSRAYASHAR